MKHFFILDGENQEPSYIDEIDGEFEVINNTNNPINFLQIDSCILNSSDDTRCDCAIYNDDTFCFIELKCIKPKNFQKKRKQAEEQLKVTIENFIQTDIVKNKTLEAFSCCNCKTKIDGKFEEITSKPKNKENVVFFELNLNTKLHCDTKKEFN